MAVPVEVVKLAPTVAAARSATITVEMGQVVVICLYGAALRHDCQATLERQVNAVWQPVNEENETLGFLSEHRREYALTAPGVYSVLKAASTTAVGVMEIR